MSNEFYQIQDYLSIEAENYTSVVTIQGSRWEKIENSHGVMYSSGLAIQYPNYSGEAKVAGEGGFTTYTLDVSKAGSYHVNILGLASDSSSDSVYVGTSESASNAVRINITTDTWKQPIPSAPIFLEEGENTLYLWVREPGSIVDKIILSESPDKPLGFGYQETLGKHPMSETVDTDLSDISHSSDFFYDNDGQIKIEAEHYHQSHDAGSQYWELISREDLNGNASENGIQAYPETGSRQDAGAGAYVVYHLNVTEEGEYNVFALGLNLSSSSDSIWIDTDNTATDALTVHLRSNVWKQGKSESGRDKVWLPEGYSKLYVWIREAGSILDQIILSKEGIIPEIESEETLYITEATSTTSTTQVPLSINTIEIDDLTKGVELEYILTTQGGEGDKIWSINSGDFPQGLTLSNNGVISGIPTNEGQYKFRLLVEDAHERVTKNVTLFVKANEDTTAEENQTVYTQIVDYFSLEAEHYSSSQSINDTKWILTTRKNFTGTNNANGITSQKQSKRRLKPGSGAYVKYNLLVTDPGEYTVYLYGESPARSSDSIYLSTDNSGREKVIGHVESYEWNKVRKPFELKEGLNHLYVWIREEASVLDKIILTKSSEEPISAGFPESERILLED